MNDRSRFVLVSDWGAIQTALEGWGKASILSANPPNSATPNRIREKPTVNWVPFPTVGRNGVPGAVAQISLS